MSEYKIAKEAFVADNPGTSIWNVNAVSLVGLTSYLLYASVARNRVSSSLWLDFATSIIPLLLGQTLFSSYPIAFNGGLIVLYILATSVFAPHDATRRKGYGKSAMQPSPEEIAQEVPLLQSLTPLVPTPLLNPSMPLIQRRRSPSSPSTATHSIKIFSPATPSFPSMTPTAEPLPTTPITPAITTKPQPKGSDIRFPPQPFLSVYRAQMMLMTVIAILAVDFPIFPREFGKCEDWGTSLMDIGVGSFVFSQGIISAGPYLRNLNGFRDPLHIRLYGPLKKTVPVLLLGIIRVVMVKGVEYPEHVTEYGVHWNFFFTLGLMPFIGTLLSYLRVWLRSRDQALVILACHQLALRGGLQDWVMSPERKGLLGMNKEGIVSLPGYISIFLLGLDIGHYILPQNPYFAFPEKITEEDEVPDYGPHLKADPRDRWKSELGMILGSYAIIWWGLLFGGKVFGAEVSRRLANAQYVLWTAAYNTTFMAGYLAIEINVFGAAGTFKGETGPRLLKAYNKNGLLVFLVANLLTGLINLSIKTMYASNAVAMTVLAGYMTVLSGFAWMIRNRRYMI